MCVTKEVWVLTRGIHQRQMGGSLEKAVLLTTPQLGLLNNHLCVCL